MGRAGVGLGELVVDVEGGGLAGLGAEGAADGGDGGADDQPDTLGGGGRATAHGQAGPAPEVGADRAAEAPANARGATRRGSPRR